MTEEEQKAIEILDTFELRRISRNYNKLDLNDVYASQIALNLISKLQEENKELREGKDTAENELKSQLEENKKLQADIEIKDKVIDELINFLLNYDIDEDYCKKIERQECNKYKEGYCDKCIKQHFYKKVEEEKC